MAAGEVLYILDQVEKRYGTGPAALGPVSLRVYGGEVLGLRGPNGAGKSTLLKLLAGVLRPDRGELRRSFDGQIGYVPQDIALYHALSGQDNLAFWGAVYGLPRRAAAARSRWLFQQMELADKATVKVGAYSGGQRRRLHLASALMVTPQLLLLDEPTVGADAHSSDLILTTIERLRDRGCGIVIISHQYGELERVCSRILYLRDGQIQREERL